MKYWRDPEKTWIYGGLRIRDGHAVTMCADRRNSLCYQDFLQQLEDDNPTGDIVVITDNLSTHTSMSTRGWLTEHPRIRPVFIPKNACWLNLQELWWRMFHRQGLAGQELAHPADIAHATAVATTQLNAKPNPGSGDDHHPEKHRKANNATTIPPGLIRFPIVPLTCPYV